MFYNRDIIDLASKFKFFSHNRPDDFADELSFKYTTFILVSASIIIIFKQYFMNPISCYLSNNPMQQDMISYLENYCWVAGTIPISYQGKMPINEEELKLLEKEKILYYQWVPFILAIQALLCYLPQLIWRMFYSTNSAVDLKHLIVKASNASNMDNGARMKEVEQLSKRLQVLLFQPKDDQVNGISLIQKLKRSINSVIAWTKRLGSHLVVFYFFVKVLYLTNSIGQIYLMRSYLNLNPYNYTIFGVKMLHEIIGGNDWKNTLVFSRVGYCFAKVRQLGVVNIAVAQCVLPVNMLNERLYIFLWFWMIVVSIATTISMIAWVSRIMIKNFQTSFIKKYLILGNNYSSGDKFNKKISSFEDKFLRGNGLFILQMLSSNAGEIITADVINNLWNVYKNKFEDSDIDTKVKHPPLEEFEDELIKTSDSKRDFEDFDKLKCDEQIDI